MTRVELRHGAATDVGMVRAVNEDAWLAAPPVYVVADGMGGHDGGDEASRIVIEEFEKLASAGYDPRDGERAVTETLNACQQRIEDFVDRHRAAGEHHYQAGTTAVVALLVEANPETQELDGGPHWLLANLGDSRIYAYDAGTLTQVTSDHSLVQELVDNGTIPPEAATGHPERHVVTRALGVTARFDADFTRVPVARAGRLLLCSDGISDLVAEADIAGLMGEPDPVRAAGRLVAAALAAGGRDNATAVVVDVVGSTEEDPDR